MNAHSHDSPSDTKVAHEVQSSELLRKCFPFVVAAYWCLLICLPTGVTMLICSFLGRVGALVAPLIWGIAWGLSAALLSLPWQSAIKPGRFVRDLGNREYFARRMYGLCWNAIYYLPIVHQLFLGSKLLRGLLYRVFGYRGPLTFTSYPDTWIRDLPLLWFGDGSYLANRATIGTNVVLPDGTIVVDRVTVGQNSMIGHAAIVGPRFKCGRGCSVGTRAMIGMGVVLGDDVQIGANASIDHFMRLPSESRVAQAEYARRERSSATKHEELATKVGP